ncbi:MAG TPA: VOC family protein [Candidatus Saccharimonadales bacterium]|nr:VOC family protein [Candidatus Saccharimonadales bacterium]
MGRVVHFEIHADDLARARSFYETVFGWSIERWSGLDYWVVKTGADKSGPDAWPGIDGGMLQREGHSPVHDNPVSAFVCTIQVDDIEETCAKVIENAGNVMVSKKPLKGVGWLCYCRDTEGNIFGVLQADKQAEK